MPVLDHVDQFSSQELIGSDEIQSHSDAILLPPIQLEQSLKLHGPYKMVDTNACQNQEKSPAQHPSLRMTKALL